MKAKLILLAIVAVFVFTALPVYAHAVESSSNGQSQTTPTTRKEANQQKLEAARERLEARQATRCEFVKAKLQFHMDQAAAIREHRQQRYNRLVERLTKLADRLDAQGIDTTDLRTKLTELDALVKTYSDSFTTYETAVQTAIGSSCEDSETFRTDLAAAKEALVRLRSNAQSVHEFFQDQIKPLLQEIKDAIKADRGVGAEGEASPAGATNAGEGE